MRNFTSRVEKYFTRSLWSLVKYYSTIEARPCDILYTLPSNTKISTQIKMVTSSLAMISATVEFTIARMSPKNWSGKRVFLIQKNLSVFSRYWAMLLNCEETRKFNKQSSAPQQTNHETASTEPQYQARSTFMKKSRVECALFFFQI